MTTGQPPEQHPQQHPAHSSTPLPGQPGGYPTQPYSGYPGVNPAQPSARRTILRWSLSSFVVALVAIFGARMAITYTNAPTPEEVTTTGARAPGEGRADSGEETGARSAVSFYPHDDGAESGVADDRPIFWTYAQFQLVDARADGSPTNAINDRWMIDDQILSTQEVADYINANKQAIRERGGLEFVCYNADYLGGIQGRLESWFVDLSSDDWVELNRIPKAVAQQFMTDQVFPAPQGGDYQHCREAVASWNTLMEA